LSTRESAYDQWAVAFYFILPSAVSHQLSAISHQLSAISHQLSAISYQLSAISHQSSAIVMVMVILGRPLHALTRSFL
jgi:hypothetical protein